MKGFKLNKEVQAALTEHVEREQADGYGTTDKWIAEMALIEYLNKYGYGPFDHKHMEQ